MINLKVTYTDDTSKEYSAEYASSSLIDELKSEQKEIKNIHARFSSDTTTLSGRTYTDFMERDFVSLEQLSVHLANM